AKSEFQKASADYDEAIRIDPKFTHAYANRGDVWLAQEDYDRAIADYTDAIRIDPGAAYAFSGRACARYRTKEFAKCIADSLEAIRLDPGDVSTLCSGAWLMATCADAKHRNGATAVEWATKACELTEWNEPLALGALAAAKAEQGEFDSAV